MIPISAEEIAWWRAELDLALDFRDKEFGTYRKQTPGSPPMTTLAGRNLDLYEQGARSEGTYEPPLNLVFPIVKTIVPTLFYQHPRATAVPDQKADEAGEDASYVSELINRDLRDVDFRFKETSQQAVFDSYVLGYGVVKIGYATTFGQDILPTQAEERKALRDRLKERVRGVMEQVGLLEPKPAEPEPEQAQEDLTIRAESPYVQWIDPFDFLVDPTARDLTDARWVAQRVRRILASVKRDRRYSLAKFELTPEAVDDDRVPETHIEEFQSIDLWEIHLKSPDSPTGIRTLTLAATQHQTKALMHEDNPYDLGGWQYEWLAPNKHGHRLYPISTLSVARPLVERINTSFDTVLEQLDKFLAKLVYNDRVTTEGQTALDDPTIGARVKVSGEGDVRQAIAVISMDQLNAEITRFLDYCMDFLILIVGLTRAQLTGLTTAQTATEAQIGQGGQNLRRTDEGNVVALWTNRVVAKLWRVKAQFQSFQDISLTRAEAVPNPETGLAATAWYPPIDEAREARLKSNRFKFHVEVSSIQKPNLEIIRAQFIEIIKGLVEPAVTNGLALEGKRLSVSEVLRQLGRFFSEQGFDQAFEKMVVPVQDEAMRQLLMGFGQKPQPQAGNGRLAGAVPTYADQVSAAAGERGQGASPV